MLHAMSEDRDDHEDEDEGEQEAVRDPQVLRTHGVTKIYQSKPGGLVTRRRIMVEDADDLQVRLVIEHDNDFGGDDTSVPLEDTELVELLRALELVAKRRGLIQALRIIGPET